eukprot:GCRY01004711.1.p1 GENE.GCRY01004711.1~~GCRY01004711.1.p1  ORF type:complete len:414 (+),score=84.23 GCRY01004711.1:188-1429(+)
MSYYSVPIREDKAGLLEEHLQLPYVPLDVNFLVNKFIPALDDFEERSEFGFSFSFHPLWVDLVCQQGCFPMAINIGSRSDPLPLFALKMHDDRCIIDLKTFTSSHGSRHRASKYTFSVNQAWEQVLNSCVAQHGENWLYPQLRTAFSFIHSHPEDFFTQFISVEIWDGDTLVAGELGYIVGKIYTSLTGFYTQSGAGSVQMTCLGLWLQKAGAKIWDLGMFLPYKTNYGVMLITRLQWMKAVSRYGTGVPIPSDLLRYCEEQSESTEHTAATEEECQASDNTSPSSSPSLPSPPLEPQVDVRSLRQSTLLLDDENDEESQRGICEPTDRPQLQITPEMTARVSAGSFFVKSFSPPPSVASSPSSIPNDSGTAAKSKRQQKKEKKKAMKKEKKMATKTEKNGQPEPTKKSPLTE